MKFPASVFTRLDKAKIDNYLAKVNPLDKAGAYAAQGHGAEIIAGIDGSFTNVVGLPMEKTTPRCARNSGIVPHAKRLTRFGQFGSARFRTVLVFSRFKTRYKNQTMKQFASRMTTAPKLGRCQRWRTSSGINARRCKDHEQLGPALLQIHAGAFGKQNRGIKKREQTGRAQVAAGERVLQLVQQIMQRLAVHDEQLIIRPIRDSFHPARSAVQKN